MYDVLSEVLLLSLANKVALVKRAAELRNEILEIVTYFFHIKNTNNTYTYIITDLLNKNFLELN